MSVERRDAEFEWRIKMRCLDENKEISAHEGTDGGHLNCNFQYGPVREGSRVRNVCASQDVERSTFTRQQYCVTSLASMLLTIPSIRRQQTIVVSQGALARFSSRYRSL